MLLTVVVIHSPVLCLNLSIMHEDRPTTNTIRAAVSDNLCDRIIWHLHHLCLDHSCEETRSLSKPMSIQAIGLSLLARNSDWLRRFIRTMGIYAISLSSLGTERMSVNFSKSISDEFVGYSDTFQAFCKSDPKQV